jgi:hypothetical protein
MSDTILTEEQQVLRREMIDALKQGVVKVIFTKVDGTQRTMRCSLNEAHLPPKPEPDPSKPLPSKPKRPPTNIVVFDVEKSEWRSFNLGSVVAWQSEN